MEDVITTHWQMLLPCEMVLPHLLDMCGYILYMADVIAILYLVADVIARFFLLVVDGKTLVLYPVLWLMFCHGGWCYCHLVAKLYMMADVIAMVAAVIATFFCG